jgi:signal transduction histidine kinase
MAAGGVGVYARLTVAVETARPRAVRVSPRTRDWLFAAGILVWGGLEQVLTRHSTSLPIGLALLLVVLEPLLICRRHPLAAAGWLGAYAPVRAALGGEAFPDVTPLQICAVVVWAQGRYVRDVRMAATGALAAVLGVGSGLLIAEADRPVEVSRLVLGGLFFTCVMAAGRLARERSEEARVERAARRSAELERERRVREALVRERSRIARELHDLVAHGVAAISIQAGVAQQWLERDPARAEQAIASARRRARSVLAEMRRLLSVLRDDDAVSDGTPRTALDRGLAVASAGHTWPLFLADAVPALVVLAFGAMELGSVRAPAPAVARLLGAAALAVVVLIRRIAPAAAAGAFALVLILRAADGQLGKAAHSPALALLILGWSLGTAAISWPNRLVGLSMLEIGAAVALPVAESHPLASDFVVLGLLPLAAFGAGSVVRRWQAAARLERARGTEAAAEQETHPQQAVVRERARVARELHDVVAHAVSIISVQAGAAEALARRDPIGAQESVKAVLAAAHHALAELRRLLELLSGDETPAAAYGPQPGLGTLVELIRSARDVGLQIELLDERTGPEPPAGVQLTAFRILQESLTNAHKHAGHVPVVVRLADRPGELEVEVRSEATRGRADAGSSGHGLLGMRERVALYGGTLDARPDGDGHWLVRAVLPVEAEVAG